MAKVYGCPENIIIPDYFAFKDSSDYNKAVDDFKEELKIFVKKILNVFMLEKLFLFLLVMVMLNIWFSTILL